MGGGDSENDPEVEAPSPGRRESRAEKASPRRSRSRSCRRARESSDDDSEVEERRRRRDKEKRRRQREEEEEEERRRHRRRERERENRHRERGYDDGHRGDRRGYDRHDEDKHGGGVRRPSGGDRYGGGSNGGGRGPRDMPSRDGDPSNAFIMERLTEREKARIRRDFGEADSIRDELLNLGIEIWESKGERTWRASDGRQGPRPNHEGKCL